MEGFKQNPYEKPRYPVIKVHEEVPPAIEREAPKGASREQTPVYRDTHYEEEYDENEEARVHSRRDLLRGGALTLLAGGIGGAAIKNEMNHGKAEASTTEPETKRRENIRLEYDLRRRIHLGQLTGVRLGGMGGRYLQWHETEPLLGPHGERIGSQIRPLPEQFTKRLDESINQLWVEKNHKYPSKVNEVMRRWQVASYREKLRTHQEGLTTLDDYIEHASQTVSQLRKVIDWHRAGELYALSPTQLQTLATIANEIDGSVLAAYSMTEIMSSGIDAKTDALLFDTILRVGGTEFIIRIPAIHDAQESFGPYQMTPLALNTNVGAAKMNLALPEKNRAPSHMHELHTIEDHHAVAFLFALHNLAETIQKVPDQHQQLFAHMPREVLIEFISASHHKPSPTRTGLLQYLHTRDAGASLAPHIKDEGAQGYAIKTAANYQTLEQIALAKQSVTHLG